MYDKCFILFVSVSIAILCHGVQSQSDSDCTTPSGQKGDCIIIYDCDSLMAVLKKANSSANATRPVKESICGFQDLTQKVCCPREECFTPDEQLGKCIPAKSCATIVNMLSQNPSQATEEYVRNYRCRDKEETNVCCGPPPRPPPDPKASCVLSSAMPDRRGRCCGRDSDADDRIIGGNETTVDQYPWMAFIEYRQEENSRPFRCAGALISGKYVLTAAHCVIAPGSNDLHPKNVRLGDFDVSNPGKDCTTSASGKRMCNNGAATIAIEKIIAHPDFESNFKVPKNDIALIRLKETVNYTGFIRPICLPSSDVFHDPPQELKLVVAGWGVNDTQTKTTTNTKHHVFLPYVKFEDCQEYYQMSVKNLPLWHKQLCAGGEEGKDSCQGDSGGPLMHKIITNPNNPVFEAVGITSTGQSCAVENTPGVYTKVYEYLPWIRSQITP